MNPLAQLKHFLTINGLKELRSQFAPPPGAYMPDYIEAEDAFHFYIIQDDTDKETKGRLPFSFFLKRELSKLLKEVEKSLEERIYSIDASKDRDALINSTLKILDQIIIDWKITASTYQYAEVEEMLQAFKAQIETNLQLYICRKNSFDEEHERYLPIEIAPNTRLPSKKDKVDVLDIRQTALLFYYLKKHQAILDYSDQSLARIVSSLTGHSEQGLRTDKGFGAIWDIIADKTKNGNFKDIPHYNLDSVRELLTAIIADIDRAKEENKGNKRK